MRGSKLSLLFLLLLAGFLPAGQNPKEPAFIKPRGGDKVTINFSGTSLKEVVKVFEQYTKKRFLFNETVVAGKKVNLLSHQPLPLACIIDVFESILAVQGLTLIRTGKPEAEIYKIVDAKSVAGQATKTFTAKDLEKIPENDRVITLVYELKYLQASQIGPALKDMTSVPNGIRIIAGSNLLIITDYSANVKRIGKILAELDAAGPKIVRETIKLKNADPLELVREVQPLINIENRVYRAQVQKRLETRMRQLLGRGGRRPTGNISNMIMDSSSPIAVAAIPRLGSVIVSATEDKIADIKELINSLDIKDPDEKVVAYYTLHYQTPSILARTLGTIFGIATNRSQARGRGARGRTPTRGVSTIKNISIIPDDESNKLIVVAAKKTHEEVSAVIEKLDSFSDYERELKYYPIANADPNTLASTISQIFGLETAGDNQVMKWARRRTSRGIVAEKKGVYSAQDMILVDKNLCSLIIIAQLEVHKKIGEMIKLLDVAGPGEKTIVYYKLKFAKAGDVATTLSSLYANSRPNQRGRGRGRTPAAADRSISVVPNEKMSTLIILAGATIHKEIKEVIANLDVESATLVLNYYAVEKGNLQEIANTLSRLFSLEVGTGAAQLNNRRNRGRRKGPGSGLAESPLIIPEQNLGALIILAEQKTHQHIAKIIKDLDVAGPGEKLIKYYTLRYQKPSILAETLSSIFSSSGARQKNRRRGQRFPQATPGTIVSFVPNDDANKLIVVGAAKMHAEVAAVIERLDAISDHDRELRYYAIKHADPEAVGNSISQLFQLETTGDNQVMKWVRIRSRRNVVAEKKGVFAAQDMILIDKNLCSLLIITQKEVHSRIAEIIKQIDIAGPGQKTIAYYKLKFARADELATTISSLFPTNNTTQRNRNRNRGRGQTPAGVDRSLTLVPSKKTDTLIILATAETHREVKDVITNLDVESAVLDLQYYPILAGDINAIAATLGRLLKIEIGTGTTNLRSRRGRRGQPTPTAEEPLIVPDENLAALLILADQGTHAKIAPIVTQLDVVGPGRKTIEYYPLKYAKAEEIGSTLASLFATANINQRARNRGRNRNQPTLDRSIAVVPNAKMSVLIVLAAPEVHREVDQVIKTLDVEKALLELKYYAVKAGEISEIADTISTLFKIRRATGAAVIRNRRGRNGRNQTVADEPVLVADTNLNALLVLAENKIQKRIGEMIAQLDLAGPGKKTAIYYNLEFAKADDVANTLSSLYATTRPNQRGRGRGRTPTGPDRSIGLVPNDKMGTVIVLATADVQTEIKAIIANLDVESATLELKYYPVKHGVITELANTISRLFKLEVGTGATNIRRSRGRNNRSRGVTEEPVVVPDANLNALVILAEKKAHTAIAKALLQLDTAGPGERVTHYYKIANTSVTDVANTLAQIFEGEVATTRRRGRPTTNNIKTAIIVPNEELSTVVVSASKEIHAQIKLVVENLDVESVKDNILRYYAVKNNDLEEVADTVAKVFGLIKGDDRRLQTMRRPGRRPTRNEQRSPFAAENIVIPDHNLASLIVVAPLEVHDKIAPVLEKIDSAGPGKKETCTYRVARTSVLEVATTIASIFDMNLANSRQRTRRKNPNQPLQTSVVIPSEALGTIIVVAPGDIQAKVKQVIEGLNTVGPDENELKYYKIEKSDLIEAANILSQIYGINVASVEETFRQRGRRQTADLLTKERVIIPNENLNTLLIVAPKEMQIEIAGTIKQIDAVGPRDHIFRMYEVTVSEVTTAAQTISQLFDIKILSTRTNVTRSRRGAPTGPKISADPFILPDEELGSIIVNAPEEIHTEIKKVLDQLVAIGKQEKMSIRFYKLRNTDCDDVATKIGNLFNILVGSATTPEKRATRKTSSTGRRGRTSGEEDEEKKRQPEPEPVPTLTKAGKSKKDFYFEGESVVIPDTNLNSIILIAPDYIHSEVKTILETLDIRRPQVLFEVAVLDITSDQDIDIGAEIISINRQGASNARGHGFTNFGLSDRESSANAGFPDTTEVATDLAGLFVGVTKGDVSNIPLLIRLLQQNTDVNIRSTPLLLVNDNEEAEFSSLEEQPTTATSQGTATTNVSFGGFVEAGTVLKITPHVSEGNYIRVDIDLKVDNFYGDSSSPGIPPPRTSNQLKTSITVPNNRTVVVGGLTTRKKTKVIKKIPLLGDIPLLGYLFSSSSDQDETSRLFLFIRPQIMNDVDFKDLNRISRDKSLEVQGITGEQIVPPEKDEIPLKPETPGPVAPKKETKKEVK